MSFLHQSVYRCNRPSYSYVSTSRHPTIAPHASEATSSEASSSSNASTMHLKADCNRLDQLLRELTSIPPTGPVATSVLLEPMASREEAVLSHIRQHTESFKTFGSGLQKVPKRIYSLDELRLNKIETPKILSPKDTELTKTRNIALAAFSSLLAAVAITSGFNHVLPLLISSTFLLFLDTISSQGRGEALITDTLGGIFFPKYRERVSIHEAGHLLIAYSVGILPKAVTLSSLDTFLTYKSLGVQAGSLFLDSEFQNEVGSGKLSSSSLDKFTCVCLGGVIAEYLVYGESEGGVNDISQLDALFRGLGFSQAKSDGEVRWAVLNCAFILRENATLHRSIAEAIRKGKPSIGELVHMIEGGAF